MEKLLELADGRYADFQAGLVPTLSRELFIGVRVPLLRKLAKELVRSGEHEAFLAELPHRYYDENVLHALILSELQDYDRCMERLERFLPYVDNWAVCDTLSPKCFRKNRERLLPAIARWSASERTYTSRFGMEMLMKRFLDGDFQPEYLEIPARVRLEDYYARMMVAWFFATALAKQWDATLPYLENSVLETWTHNKAIQKARESYRITTERKAYLNSLKR